MQVEVRLTVVLCLPSDDVSECNEDFNATIRAAEWESIETCEVCGAAGAQYVINLWVSTLCDQHHDARTTEKHQDAGA